MTKKTLLGMLAEKTVPIGIQCFIGDGDARSPNLTNTCGTTTPTCTSSPWSKPLTRWRTSRRFARSSRSRRWSSPPGSCPLRWARGTAGDSSPKIQEAQRKVHAAAQRHNVALIGGPILNPTAESCAKALEAGISILCIGRDTLAFRQLCETTVAAANAVAASGIWNRPPAPPSAFPRLS